MSGKQLVQKSQHSIALRRSLLLTSDECCREKVYIIGVVAGHCIRTVITAPSTITEDYLLILRNRLASTCRSIELRSIFRNHSFGRLHILLVLCSYLFSVDGLYTVATPSSCRSAINPARRKQTNSMMFTSAKRSRRVLDYARRCQMPTTQFANNI